MIGELTLMKHFGAENIKNIAIAGHAGSGKTSLAEALLFKSGAVDRLGKTVLPFAITTLTR